MTIQSINILSCPFDEIGRYIAKEISSDASTVSTRNIMLSPRCAQFGLNEATLYTSRNYIYGNFDENSDGYLPLKCKRIKDKITSHSKHPDDYNFLFDYDVGKMYSGCEFFSNIHRLNGIFTIYIGNDKISFSNANIIYISPSRDLVNNVIESSDENEREAVKQAIIRIIVASLLMTARCARVGIDVRMSVLNDLHQRQLTHILTVSEYNLDDDYNQIPLFPYFKNIMKVYQGQQTVSDIADQEIRNSIYSFMELYPIP